MTRHSSLDDGCLPQGNPKERLSARFYYASRRTRDVLAESQSASRRTRNLLIFQCKQAVLPALAASRRLSDMAEETKKTSTMRLPEQLVRRVEAPAATANVTLITLRQ